MSVLLAAAMMFATTAQPGGASGAIPGDDLVRLNGAWFVTVCRTTDPVQQARCDGFIQGIASAVRARRFGRCGLEAPASEIREQVMARLTSRPSRSPASQAIWQVIDAAFPCRTN